MLFVGHLELNPTLRTDSILKYAYRIYLIQAGNFPRKIRQVKGNTKSTFRLAVSFTMQKFQEMSISH